MSRSRKRRLERNIKDDDEMKSLLNKIETERKKKNKNLDKIKELEIKLVKNKYINIPDKLQSELKELNKIKVFKKIYTSFNRKILVDYTSEFEMVGNLKVGDEIRQTHIRFRNISDYEAYLNSIDEGYDAEASIFNGYIYKNQYSTI